VTGPALHATTVAAWRHGAWRGVLIRGASGAGKSTLALKCIEAGWRLVADDRTLVWSSGGRLFGRAPDALAGLVEARGLGVLPVPHLAWVEIALVVDLAPPDAIERLPDPAALAVAGASLPVLALWPHDTAALAKLNLSLACTATPLGVPDRQAYQTLRADMTGQGSDATRGRPKRIS
jgi:hypothetical protein